jgi:hypothetical protein
VRTLAYRVIVMLLVQYALGMWTNLYAPLPASDHASRATLVVHRGFEHRA